MHPGIASIPLYNTASETKRHLRQSNLCKICLITCSKAIKLMSVFWISPTCNNNKWTPGCKYITILIKTFLISKCYFLWRANSTVQTPFTRVFPPDLTAKSTEAMRIRFRDQGHRILMPPVFEPSISVSRNRHLTHMANMLKKVLFCPTKCERTEDHPGIHSESFFC